MRQRLTTEAVERHIAALPEVLSNRIRGIKLHTRSCPVNKVWAARTGDAGFKAFATSDLEHFSIDFWRNDHHHDPLGVLPYIVCHESAHLLDRFLGYQAAKRSLKDYIRRGMVGNLPKGCSRWWWSSGKTWTDAMGKDYSHVGDFWVSQYADSQQATYEDFADSVAYYLTRRRWIAARFPYRTEVLETMFGNTDFTL